MKKITSALFLFLLISAALFAGPVEDLTRGIQIGRNSCASPNVPVIRTFFNCTLTVLIPNTGLSYDYVGAGVSPQLCRNDAIKKCEAQINRGLKFFCGQASNPIKNEQRLVVDYGDGRVETLPY